MVDGAKKRSSSASHNVVSNNVDTADNNIDTGDKLFGQNLVEHFRQFEQFFNKKKSMFQGPSFASEENGPLSNVPLNLQTFSLTNKH
jgi:hypothetical protein